MTIELSEAQVAVLTDYLNGNHVQSNDDILQEAKEALQHAFNNV